MSTDDTGKATNRRGKTRNSSDTTSPETMDPSPTEGTPLNKSSVATLSQTESPAEPTPLPDLKLPESPQASTSEARGKGAAIVPAAQQSMTHQPQSPLPGNRPITPSRVQFRYSQDLPNRPVAQNTIQIRYAEDLPGHRPIAASQLQVYKTGFLPGNRPIVPTNKSEATEEMIGYID